VLECWLSFPDPLLDDSVIPGSTPLNDLLISVDGRFSKAGDLFWTKVMLEAFWKTGPWSGKPTARRDGHPNEFMTVVV
jgi:hypothetical protein